MWLSRSWEEASMQLRSNLLSRYVLLGLCLFCIGCGEDLPLKKYYFPSDGSKLNYTYRTNEAEDNHWLIETTKEGWHIRVYNDTMAMIQESMETAYINGVQQDQLRLFGDNQSIEVDIRSGFLYPYEKLDSLDVLVHHIQWAQEDEQAYQVIRNRRFIGLRNKDYDGEMWACAVFKLEEHIISLGDGDVEIIADGEEWYAEGIGLIYRQRRYSDENVLTERLILREANQD